MPSSTTQEAIAPSHAAKRAAALLSVIAAAGVTLLKLITGLVTGSLGMISDAAHSGIDLVAAILTMLSVQVSDRPADEDHNYGHGKIESVSAFIETFIMLASCLFILYEAVRRIVFHPQRLALHFSIWPFAVLLLSIAVDYSRSRNLRKVAALHHSEALSADAIHFSTDVWSSLAVLVGLAATYAGTRFHVAALEYADPIAAIFVSAVIFRVSWQLARRTIDALLDSTPAETRRNLIQSLAATPGVLSVDRVRTRRSGASYFADLTLGMPRNLTFQRSEQINMAATDAVRNLLPDADVVIHSVPTASILESVHDRIRAVAARANLNVHDVSVQQHGSHLQHQQHLHVDQHLEVDEAMPLRQAHDLVTRLEADIRSEVPNIVSILTHIESEPATIERPALLEHDLALERRLRHTAEAFPEILDIHEILITRIWGSEKYGTADRTEVTCHATFPDSLPMARVHAVMTALEGAFKLQDPEVSRLLIHPEPATDNRR